MSIATKTAQGIVWNAISYGGGKLLTFISTLILMRVLAPESFGPVELALIAITVLDALGDLGIGAALIYQRDNVERASHISFTISLIMGFVLWGLATLGAPAYGAFYNSPEVVPLLRVLAINFLIQSFGNTHSSLLAKNLNFKRKLLPDLMRTVSKGTLSIVLALSGWGAWSLVWGQVIGELATTIALWVVQPFRPRLLWDRILGRTMMVYGLQIIGVELIAVVYTNADYLIVGKLLGTTDLALYRRAFSISTLLITSICFITARVLFPSLAKLHADLERLRRAYLASVRYTGLATLPLAVGLCAIAPLFVGVLFPDWIAMVPALQLLAIRAGIGTLTFNSGSLYKAAGRTNLLSIQVALRTVALVLIVLATVRYGFVGVAFGQLVLAVLSLVTDFATVRHFMGVPFGGTWRALRTSLFGSIVMGVLVWLFISGTPDTWPVLKLVGAVCLGAVAYGGILWLTDRRLTEQVRHEVLQALSPKRAAAAK